MPQQLFYLFNMVA